MAIPRTQKKFRVELNWNKVLARPGKYGCVVVLDGLKPTFNVGKIFRSVYALGAKEVHLVGLNSFNPFPAMGTFRYVVTHFHPDFETCHAVLKQQEYSMYALQASAERSLVTEKFPEKTAFILGHEESGLSFRPDDFPDVVGLRIPMEGGVESLNVSIAASLSIYEYIRQSQPRRSLS